MYKPASLFLLFSILFLQNIFAQEGVIRLANPSFEGMPKEGSLRGPMPEGWLYCGAENETVPDIHPVKDGGAFQVTMSPKDGKTYLGMVVRDNDTWESVTQELSSPLLPATSYVFNIYLCRSDMYASPSKKDGNLVNYASPVALRIWGGNEVCEKKELLGEISAVNNTRWLNYELTLNPSQSFKYLILEAYYHSLASSPYNGNILIDHASELIPVKNNPAPANPKKEKTEKGGDNKNLQGEQGLKEKDPRLQRYEFSEPLMGTEFRIILYTEDQSLAASASREAFNRVSELEQIMSNYIEESELSRLSATSGSGEKVAVSEDFWTVLKEAYAITEKSKGAFDITAGALTKYWRRAFREGKVPEKKSIDNALKTVGYKKMRIYESRQVELFTKGLELDLGGIAKGYAVDEALKVLNNKAVKSALVDGGGDLAASNPPPGETGWIIERVKYENGAEKKEHLSIANEAIATSGDTYRYIEQDGKRYSHIIDPRSGYGVSTRQIVSVKAPTCMQADAWATAFSVEVDTDAFLQLKKEGFTILFSSY